MKTVTLPNGKVAHFPETIKPEVMQAAIAKHGQPKPSIVVKHDTEDEKDRMDREQRQENAHTARHVQSLAVDTDHHNKSMQAMGEHTKATTSVANGVNKGLDAVMKVMAKNAIILEGLNGKLDALTKAVSEVKGLSKCVDDLAEQISKSSEMLVKVMKSPRKLVHNSKGKPMGMQIGDD